MDIVASLAERILAKGRVEWGAFRNHDALRKAIAAVVPGIGYDCFAQWLQPPGTVARHVTRYGYEMQAVKVDALSGWMSGKVRRSTSMRVATTRPYSASRPRI